MECIINNKEWVFSGIGVFILGLIVTLLTKKNSNKISQKQKSGNNSTNIQAGGNVVFNKKND